MKVDQKMQSYVLWLSFHFVTTVPHRACCSDSTPCSKIAPITCGQDSQILKLSHFRSNPGQGRVFTIVKELRYFRVLFTSECSVRQSEDKYLNYMLLYVFITLKASHIYLISSKPTSCLPFLAPLTSSLTREPRVLKCVMCD